MLIIVTARSCHFSELFNEILGKHRGQATSYRAGKTICSSFHVMSPSLVFFYLELMLWVDTGM